MKRKSTIVEFSASEPSTFACSLDGASFAPCTSPLTVPLPTQRSHHLEVIATDLLGNGDPSAAAFDFTNLSKAPTVTISSHPGPFVNATSADFGFASNDPAATLECKLDGGSGKDAKYSWTVDTTAPTTTLLSHPDDPTTSTTAAFKFSSSDGKKGLFECQIDAGPWLDCKSGVKYKNLTPHMGHNFAVRAKDAAGNVDGKGAQFGWTIS